MPIITVATSKGGAGKTTLARLLMGAAAQQEFTVAALDADENRTLADWTAASPELAGVTVHHEKRADHILPAVSMLTEAHDFIVIDTAGAALEATAYAMGCADLVLIPVGVNAADVTEAVKTMRTVERVREQSGRTIPARVVLTAYKPRTQLGEHILGLVAEVGLPTLNTRLADLIAFREMSFNGHVPASGMAGLVVGYFFDEVMALLPPTERTRRVA